MKRNFTGNTLEPSPSTQLSDWDNAVIKQAGVEVGRVRVRGAQKTEVKIQTTMRLDTDILAAFLSESNLCLIQYQQSLSQPSVTRWALTLIVFSGR